MCGVQYILVQAIIRRIGVSQGVFKAAVLCGALLSGAGCHQSSLFFAENREARRLLISTGIDGERLRNVSVLRISERHVLLEPEMNSAGIDDRTVFVALINKEERSRIVGRYQVLFGVAHISVDRNTFSGSTSLLTSEEGEVRQAILLSPTSSSEWPSNLLIVHELRLGRSVLISYDNQTARIVSDSNGSTVAVTAKGRPTEALLELINGHRGLRTKIP